MINILRVIIARIIFVLSNMLILYLSLILYSFYTFSLFIQYNS